MKNHEEIGNPGIHRTQDPRKTIGSPEDPGSKGDYWDPLAGPQEAQFERMLFLSKDLLVNLEKLGFSQKQVFL